MNTISSCFPGIFAKTFCFFRNYPIAKHAQIMYNTIVAQLTAHADVAQQVERILGKDEVTGSNPVISSSNRLAYASRFFAASASPS